MKRVIFAVAPPSWSGPSTVTASAVGPMGVARFRAVRAHLEAKPEVGNGEQHLSERVRRRRHVHDGRQHEVAVQHRLADVDELRVLFGDDLGEPRRHAGAVGPCDVQNDAIGMLGTSHVGALIPPNFGKPDYPSIRSTRRVERSVT